MSLAHTLPPAYVAHCAAKKSAVEKTLRSSCSKTGTRASVEKARPHTRRCKPPPFPIQTAHNNAHNGGELPLQYFVRGALWT